MQNAANQYRPAFLVLVVDAVDLEGDLLGRAVYGVPGAGAEHDPQSRVIAQHPIIDGEDEGQTVDDEGDASYCTQAEEETAVRLGELLEMRRGWRCGGTFGHGVMTTFSAPVSAARANVSYAASK